MRSFVGCSLGEYVMFFLVIRLGLWFGSSPRAKVPFSSRGIKSLLYYISMNSTMDGGLDYLAEVVLVRFLHRELTLPFPLFPACTL